MNRLEIKSKAKNIVKEKLKDFWAGYGIILAISFLLSLAVQILTNSESTLNLVLSIVVSCFSMTLSVGFYAYILKMVRKKRYNRDVIFSYIGKVLPIVAISLLTFILSFLWSFLFIIPGIIAAISYSFVYLVYVDNNDLSPMECLSKSKELLKGYKMDYVIFNLSFLGWIISCVLIIPMVFVIPYYMTSEVLYYDELKKLKAKEDKQSENL